MVHVGRTDSIPYHEIIPEIELSQVLSLKLQTKGMQWNKIRKGHRTVDHRKKHPAVMIDIIPIVDWGMHLPHDDRMIIYIIKLHQ